MRVYSVFEPIGAASLAERREQTELVAEGFAVLAFAVPVLWLAWHRLWVALGGLVTVVIAGAGLLWAVEAPAEVWSIGAWAVAFLTGQEAAGLRRADLERRGYREVAVVSGATREDCEVRYFAGRADIPTALVKRA